MLEGIASLFGYVLNYLYVWIGNYGVAILLFTLLIRLVWLPFSIKQQRNMKKTAKIQEKMTVLQNKYKNNQEQLNKEISALYKEEKVNPLSGCLSTIAQLIVFISIFYLVSRPLTYMVKLTDVYNPEANESEQVTVVDHYINELKDSGEQLSYPEIKVIEKYGEEDKRVFLNMNFLGLDLSKVPTQNADDWKVFIIPVLYIITTFASMKITTELTKTDKQKQKEKEAKEKKKQAKLAKKDGEKTVVEVVEEENPQESMQSMTKGMTYMMPVMSIAIALIAPLGLSLYWFVSGLLMLLERVIIVLIDKKFSKEA